MPGAPMEATPPDREPGAAEKPDVEPHGPDLAKASPRGLEDPQWGCPITPTLTPLTPIPTPPILLTPNGVVAIDRRAATGTTSSSTDASADDPNTTPFGLGDLLTGEFDPGLELSAPTSPVGLAIGAIGREIGPGAAPTPVDPPGRS